MISHLRLYTHTHSCNFKSNDATTFLKLIRSIVIFSLILVVIVIAIAVVVGAKVVGIVGVVGRVAACIVFFAFEHTDDAGYDDND